MLHVKLDEPVIDEGPLNTATLPVIPAPVILSSPFTYAIEPVTATSK